MRSNTIDGFWLGLIFFIHHHVLFILFLSQLEKSLIIGFLFIIFQTRPTTQRSLEY